MFLAVEALCLNHWTTREVHLIGTSFFFFLLLLLSNFIYLWIYLAALGLYCCMSAFSSCGEKGLLFNAVLGLPVAVASFVAERGL